MNNTITLILSCLRKCNLSFLLLFLLQYITIHGFSSPKPYLFSQNQLSEKPGAKDDVYISEVYNIADLTPNNNYELQVLSRLDNYKGSRISNYLYPVENLETNNELNIKKKEFYESLSTEIFDLNEIKTSQKKYDGKTSFECDMYFSSEQSIPCIETFLFEATEKIWKLNSIKYKEYPVPGNWIFIEISQGARLLAQKLWQLERAAHLLPTYSPSFNPSAVVVLLNGSQEDAEEAVRNIKIPASFKINQLPIYVGWTPTRNIHKEFRLLKDGLNEIKTQVSAQSVQIKGIATQVSTQSVQIKGI